MHAVGKGAQRLIECDCRNTERGGVQVFERQAGDPGGDLHQLEDGAAAKGHDQRAEASEYQCHPERLVNLPAYLVETLRACAMGDDRSDPHQRPGHQQH